MTGNTLYTLGEVIDNINYGKYAISTSDLDENSIISVDKEGWAYIVYSGVAYKSYGINMKITDQYKEKRWLIKDLTNEIEDFLDDLPELNN